LFTQICISHYHLAIYFTSWGRGSRDRMVVRFTTINAINAYHH